MVLKHLVTKVKLKIKFNIIFLVFLAAIIIGGYFCYLIVSEYIISLYSDNMKNIIKQNSRNIEMKYEELNDRIYDISRNSKVGELLRQRKYEGNPIIKANIDSKISKEISELINTKNDFLNIFILTKDNEALLAKNEEIISKDEFLGCDEVTEYFNIKKKSVINPVLIDNRKVTNKVIKKYFPRAVTLFYDIRPPSSIKNEGTIVCYIYDKVFLSILNDIDIGKKSEVFVIGKKGI